jgi:hypothetical protein
MAILIAFASFIPHLYSIDISTFQSVVRKRIGNHIRCIIKSDPFCFDELKDFFFESEAYLNAMSRSINMIFAFKVWFVPLRE